MKVIELGTRVWYTVAQCAVTVSTTWAKGNYRVIDDDGRGYIARPDELRPLYAVGEVVIYENHGNPVEAVVSFVSALGLYVVKWPGHTCTAREGELRAAGAI